MTAKKKLIRRRPTKTTEAAIVQQLSLKHVRLVESEAWIRTKTGELPKRSKLFVQTSFGKSSENETLGGQLSCEVVSHYEGANEPAIKIRCVYQMIYTMVAGAASPTARDIKSQGSQINAMLSIQAWPYVREHVQSTSMKMGLPPLILQPIVFTSSVTGDGRLELAIRPVQR